MGKVLVIDITKCNGCHNCQIACKDEHVGNDWSPIAKPQPAVGQFWTKVTDMVRGTVPKVKVSYLHTICQHCDTPLCIEACEERAIYKRSDGIVIIDPEKCQGSRKCMDACPFEGVIFFNETLNIAQKCTFCAHLIDKGWNATRCSDVCPTDAITFGDEEEMAGRIAEAETLLPEADATPRVYYIGLPKRFVGGTVFDPAGDEVLIGADITLTEKTGGRQRSAVTDDFGDFWEDGLSSGLWEVAIEMKGYQRKVLAADLTRTDINLGDIPMKKV